VARNGGLPHALPRPDHCERRKLEGLEAHGVETEVRTDVREPCGECAARELEAPPRVEDRLVGEVDDGLGVHRVDRLVERVVERDAVVLVPA
jgi:hypothetical protein